MATTKSRSTDTPAAKPKRRAKAATTSTPRGRSRKAPAAPSVVAHDDIARRAFAIFEAEGGGDETAHWLRAERELTGD